MSQLAPFLQEAVRYQLAGQLQQAEALYRQVLQRDPKNAVAWKNLGLIAAAVNNHAAAAQLFSRALALDPPDITTRLNLATSLKALGQRTEALALFQEAWKREFGPGFASAGDYGVRELVRRLCTDPIGPWASVSNFLCAYAELVEEQGAFRGLEPLLDEVRASIALADANPAELEVRLFVLLDTLGFLKTADKQWNAKVFHALALPWMKEALALGCHDLALKLESKVYEAYVKQTETEQHFRDCFNQWVPAMREAGQRAGAGLRPVSWPEGNGAPVVGFFLHTANLLAHVEVLLNMLEGWAGLDAKPFIPRVYAFSGNKPPMVERFAKLGVPVVLLEQSCPEAGQDLYRRLLCLRERCAEDKVSAVVWVSLAAMMPLAFALRLAPVQIWWAMKYHSLSFEDIDGYFANGYFEHHKMIDGRSWSAVRNAMPRSSLHRADARDAARELRRKFQCEMLLGSMGREEKLDTPGFLETIVRILQARPNAAFLWTGRIQLPSVQRYFDANGVADRCHYVGWIDTLLYSQVLDIYTDTFPFGGGHTVFQGMAAAKPVVMFLSREAMESGVPMAILPALHGGEGEESERAELRRIFLSTGGEDLFLCAKNTEEYYHFVLRLIDDEHFRRQVGEAGRRFVERFLTDTKKMALSFNSHLIETIANKLSS